MKRSVTLLFVLSIAIGTPCVHGAESPDASLNPQSGLIEIADPIWAGDNYDIRFVVAPGERAKISDVSIDPADDLRPRMATNPAGDTYVVWWRDSETAQVLFRRHDHAGDTWSDESVLSDPTLPAKNPEIVHDGSDPWVAFTEESALETRIKVGAIQDGPDPFGVIAEIATTDHDGSVDLGIHSAAGHLWVTWTDSDLDLAWAEYDHESATWSIPDYESYADDSPKHAMERVRITVLGD
jgi:hypothetical protein